MSLLLVQGKYQHVKVYSHSSDHDNILYLNRILTKLIIRHPYFCGKAISALFIKWSVPVCRSTKTDGAAVTDIFGKMALLTLIFLWPWKLTRRLSRGWHSRRQPTFWNSLIHNLSVVLFIVKRILKKISNSNQVSKIILSHVAVHRSQRDLQCPISWYLLLCFISSSGVWARPPASNKSLDLITLYDKENRISLLWFHYVINKTPSQWL